MSKSQHGNKEAKKPKQLKQAASPLAPIAVAPLQARAAPAKDKRKR